MIDERYLKELQQTLAAEGNPDVVAENEHTTSGDSAELIESIADIDRQIQEEMEAQNKPAVEIPADPITKLPANLPVNDLSEVIDKKLSITITDSDRERMLDALLFNTPYTETLELFDGKLKMTFRVRTDIDGETILRTCNMLRATEKLSNTADDLIRHLQFLALGLTVTRIEVIKNNILTKINFPTLNSDISTLTGPAIPETTDQIEAEPFYIAANTFLHYMKRLQQPVIKNYLTALSYFDLKIAKLLTEMTSENFSAPQD